MESGNKIHNYTGISLTITIIAVLAYEYAAFMGLNYMLEGYDFEEYWNAPKYILSSLITICLTIVLLISIREVCKSKMLRDKRHGLPKEIFSAVIITAVLLLGSLPFVKFLNIYDSRDELTNSIYEMRKSVSHLNEEYNEYVELRLADFDRYAKKSYKASGKMVKKSLERRLKPENLDSLAQARSQWLSSLNDVSIWNIMTARNVRAIIEASRNWDDQYANVSKIIYQHEVTADAEPYQAFSSATTKSTYNEWKQRFASIDTPDIRTTAAFVAIILLILTVYLTIKRPKNVVGGSHGR